MKSDHPVSGETFTRRFFLGASAAALGMSGSPLVAGTRDCLRKTRQGILRGQRSSDVDVFRGVPYAGSVSGRARFRQAPPPPVWQGVRDASRLGAPSIQPVQHMAPTGEPAPAEDCLFLNIWSPRGGAPLKPVMVYSHGGGLVIGSGGSPAVDGTRLAVENDVVVVTTNHRLGALGFLYLDHLGGPEYRGSGNRGIEDIALALRWIAKNISMFGGDPANVTIFGESGGGIKTSCLYAMPAAAPYFHKASIESGPGVRLLEIEQAKQMTDRVLAYLRLDRTNWRALLDLAPARILEAQLVASPPIVTPPAWGGRSGLVGDGNALGFFPVRDGRLLPHHPFDPAAPNLSRDKPLMVGGNADEQMLFSMNGKDVAAWSLDDAGLEQRITTVFGPRSQEILSTYRDAHPHATPSAIYFAIQSDLFSHEGSTVIAERKAAQGGAKVYRWILEYRHGGQVPGTMSTLGAMHAIDIPFKFDNVDARFGELVVAGPRPEKVRLGRAMSAAWANFAKTGIPAAPGQPAWPAYDLATRQTMHIDTSWIVESDEDRSTRLLWEKISRPDGTPPVMIGPQDSRLE